MINSHFTLEQGIVERLKTIKNKSALVNQLLAQYFLTNVGDMSIIQQKKEAILADVSIKAEEIRILEGKEAELLNLAQEEEQKNLSAVEKENKRLAGIKKSLTIDVGRELTQEEFKAYMDSFNSGKMNYWDFVEMCKNGK